MLAGTSGGEAPGKGKLFKLKDNVGTRTNEMIKSGQE